MKRQTKQREAIRQAILDVKRPMSAPEVRDRAEAHLPGIGMATVYRAIKELVDEEWLKPIEIPGKSICYELNNLPHHHHFLCRRCERVFEIDCPGKIDFVTPTGFKVEHHEITLVGLCKTCQRQPK